MLIDRAPAEMAALTAGLHQDASALSPIRFTIEPRRTSGVQAGDVAGFAGLD